MTQRPNVPGHNLFISSISALASIGAVGATFLGTAPFYAATIVWVTDYLSSHYGAGFDQIISYAWWGISAVTVFALCKAITGGVLYLGGIILARRIY